MIAMSRFVAFIILLLFSFAVSAQTTEKVDSIISKELKDFQCDDGPCAEMLTGNSAPHYKGGFDKLASNLNQNLSVSKKVSGDMLVTFLINCKAEIGFVRLLARGRWKGLNNYIDSEGESFKKTFISVANWHPAFKNGEEIDAMHSIVVSFKKGEVVAIEDSY